MVRSEAGARAVTGWGELAIAVLVGAVLVDLSLFGFSVYALGLGTWFAGPAAGERVLYDRRATVHRGPLVFGWHWWGRLIVTDRRIVSTWGLYSRVAVLDVALAEVIEARRAWLYFYPAVRVRYRRGDAERSLRVLPQRFVFGARTELLEAFARAGVPVPR